MVSNRLTLPLSILALCLSATAAFCDTESGTIDGKKSFDKHCAVCHPNGGNTINAQKPLNRKSLKANGITSAKDIVATLRKPGPGMPAFDRTTIPDKEAKAIADYVLKAFK
jgi:cytochrome c6